MWKNLKQAIALLIIYAMECDLSIEKINNPVNKFFFRWYTINL